MSIVRNSPPQNNTKVPPNTAFPYWAYFNMFQQQLKFRALLTGATVDSSPVGVWLCRCLAHTLVGRGQGLMLWWPGSATWRLNHKPVIRLSMEAPAYQASLVFNMLRRASPRCAMRCLLSAELGFVPLG